MWRFALKENIAHLKLLLSRIENPTQRQALQAELREAEQELAKLELLSSQASGAPDQGFDGLLTTILRDEVKQDLANSGIIQLLEVGFGRLHIAAQVNFRKEFLQHFSEFELEEGSVWARILDEGVGLWVEDVAEADFFAPHLEAASEAGFRAFKALPLARSAGRSFGMLSLHFAEPQSWSDEQRGGDRRRARMVADRILDIRPSLDGGQTPI